jgi:hypothetical protein
MRLRSVVCSTEVLVIRAPEEALDVRCGGAAMVALEAAPESEAGPQGGSVPALAEGTKTGKRYASEAHGLELLCTKAGQGSLSVGDERLETKAPKPLPSSD